ncbi:MAG: B-4DMT family transporter [Mycobacterium sp.]|nr:B-4DMT family transporter [Mycobacterium sp.]
MAKWLSRGLLFAALMVVVRLVHGTLINQFATHAVTISVSLCALVVVLALLWGWFDGRGDARANPDPDRRADLAMTWLLAGLVAGLVSGPVSWLISMAYKPVYTDGLISELTTFAAFTALLVFLPAVLGVAVGRWLTDRNAPPAARHGSAHAEVDYDRADTDVFAAVRDDTADGTPTGEAATEPHRAE